MQREIQRLIKQVDNLKASEREQIDKAEKQRMRADDLEKMVHKGKEGDRKELIELQLKASQLE